MRYEFPYSWADPLDLDALRPCSVYDIPDQPTGPPPNLSHCLHSPIETPPLAEHVRNAGRVLILVDDLTRDTPRSRLLPELTDYLFTAGIDEENVTVLVAAGMHRPMSDDEMRTCFGGAICERFRVVNHVARDEGNLEPVGRMQDGTQVTINRLVKEHDFVLAVGQISPHRVAGFSGGAKMILPGVSGEEVTVAVHWRGWLCEGEEVFGVVETPVRLEMEAVAEQAGLDFIVNVVLTADHRLYGIYAGDFRAAFRRGAESSRRLLSTPVDRADIVVVDSHPYDIDIWQACKAISVAELVVRRGGTIILVTPCPEGLSAHSSYIEEVGYLPCSEIVRRVEEGRFPDRLTACHMMALGRILERGELIVVSSGLSPAALERVGLKGANGVGEAVSAARARLGPVASIAILRN